jgi:Spy/CpxP family protein refolding chaperone
MSTRDSSKTWLRWIGGLATLALVVTLAPVLDAQGPGLGPGPGRMGWRGMAGRMDVGLGRLDLTEAQREQVRTIVQRHREDFQGVAERMRVARKALDDAINAEQVNEGAIRNASATLADIQADGAVLRAKVRQEVWGLLTPEQRQKATALRAERERRAEVRKERAEQRLKQRRVNPGQ